MNIRMKEFSILIDDDIYDKMNNMNIKIHLRKSGQKNPYCRVRLYFGKKSKIPLDLNHNIRKQFLKGSPSFYISLSNFVLNKPGIIDHINSNSFDNRRENLRVATARQNSQNRRAIKNKITGSYKGVHYLKENKRWRASIFHEGKRIPLGYFDDEKSAAIAYNNAAKKFFGEFAYLNKINAAFEKMEGE